jgi:4-aminobutyrate aminotransferase-like enzyme
MNEKTIDATFYKLLKQFEGTIGARTAEMLREDWDHGEAVISFETLLDNLQEQDAKVDTETRQELRSIAEDLGMLDDERGKGLYW